METTQLAIEYRGEASELNDEQRARIEQHFRKLTRRNRDLLEASVSLSKNSGDSTPREYEVRIVVHRRPDLITAVGKGATTSAALTEALNSTERQVRNHRDRMRSRQRRNGTEGPFDAS